jgi:Ca2+-transporting ATPase
MQGEKFMLLLKGAPEIILGKCTKLSGDPSGCGTSVSAMEEISKYTSRGMRTLAFARAEISYEDKMLPINDLIDDYSFEYVGFAAMADHMRPGIPESVEKCKRAGIRIIMVTGDMVETAVNIARGAGIWQPEDGADNRISGRDFQRLSEEEAAAAAKKLKVVFRARPADKLKLVKALESDGEIVAVTGDGTNDAPALNYANIGLSMGSGSSVAKQASDIILLDDSFSSVVTAVKWGRSIYRNIQKFLQYQLTINLTALVVALSGPFIGVEFPFTVTQMLWINIIMDTFAALALASEPADENVLYNKPRKTGNFIITGKMLKNITGQGAFFIVILLGMLLWFNRDGIMSVKELSMFFTTFVMLQFWNLFNARTLYSVRSAFYRIKENRSFIIIASIILLLQVLIDAFGGDVFRTEPIGLKNWIIITILTSLVLWGGELGRVIKVKRKTRK